MLPRAPLVTIRWRKKNHGFDEKPLICCSSWLQTSPSSTKFAVDFVESTSWSKVLSESVWMTIIPYLQCVTLPLSLTECCFSLCSTTSIYTSSQAPNQKLLRPDRKWRHIPLFLSATLSATGLRRCRQGVLSWLVAGWILSRLGIVVG
jgi:hypothetical protein